MGRLEVYLLGTYLRIDLHMYYIHRQSPATTTQLPITYTYLGTHLSIYVPRQLSKRVTSRCTLREDYGGIPR